MRAAPSAGRSPTGCERMRQMVRPGFTFGSVSNGERVSALALRGLYKQFDGKVAVKGINLDVPTGSFFGLLGPNGAGKTTSLSMAVGLLRPDQGQAFVLGHDVWADPVRAKR